MLDCVVYVSVLDCVVYVHVLDCSVHGNVLVYLRWRVSVLVYLR